MEQYTGVSYQLAEKVTKAYSTSFSSSSQLFDASIRKHIFAVYGLVRIADEIVDTYMGDDAERLLDELEDQVLSQLQLTQSFSTNPIVHAFVATARQFDVDESLIKPFFASMRTDLSATKFDQPAYDDYIYGSAEVIGLMCLKVFTLGNQADYQKLAAGAKALGSAYQKVNFLRDMKADYEDRGRVYFPGVSYQTFSDQQKATIEADIAADFLVAQAVIPQLPSNSRRAVKTSYDYYWQLFLTLQKASAADVTAKRLRVPNIVKLGIYIKAKVLSA